ncbi:hypothetical protein Hdeb2414_s0011g00362091 [Helianthus debilis subsp. tardiflorus]
MHASESHLGSDITKSYLASFAQEYSGEFITATFYCFTFFFCKCFRGGKTCTIFRNIQSFKQTQKLVFLNHITNGF